MLIQEITFKAPYYGDAHGGINIWAISKYAIWQQSPVSRWSKFCGPAADQRMNQGQVAGHTAVPFLLLAERWARKPLARLVIGSSALYQHAIWRRYSNAWYRHGSLKHQFEHCFANIFQIPQLVSISSIWDIFSLSYLPFCNAGSTVQPGTTLRAGLRTWEVAILITLE